ncbi:MAG: hypothetical protein K1Y01_14890 [Vicinamibacteria bacterium]|nr:hypothetical protein [Vicinamibacteria bacterium]
MTTRWLAGLCLALTLPSLAAAQADEIQVYDGGLAAKGTFNLTLHNNYIARGLKERAFDGAVVADKSWNGVPEWAFGVTDWFEAGLYLPLYTLDKDLGFGIDGVKLRALFAAPNGDNRRFVYGANFEFSYNAKRWDSTRITSEVRPIIGWHFKSFDLIFNPIVDTAYDGFGKLEFVPAARVAFNVAPKWQAAVEQYSNFGHFSDFYSRGQQSHNLYAVVDHAGKTWDFEFGVGFGLNDASDKLTFKMILARDLWKRKPKT